MAIEIIRHAAGAGEACRSILAELPDWFGIAQSNAAYAALAEAGPAWLVREKGETLAIMLLKDHGADAAEIYFLAGRPAAHRHGLGRALVDRGIEQAASQGAGYLTVKTQGPSADYEPYARTRAFYRALGFVALEEFTQLWAPENPALFMVRPVERPNG